MADGRMGDERKDEQTGRDGGVDSGDGGEDGDKNAPMDPAHKRRFIVIAAIVVIALILIGVIWWLDARNYEDTDDAFIDTHIVFVAPQTHGQILHVYVKDNQLVRAGAPLVDIDPASAQAKLDQALARQAEAQAKLVQAQTQVEVAEADYDQIKATGEGIEAQAVNAGQVLVRYRKLQEATPEAVAQQQVDQAVAAARDTKAQEVAAGRRLAAAKVQIATAHAALLGARAQGKAAAAQVASAQLELGYTHIVAPVSGHIAKRTTAIGNYVTPGRQLLAIVPLHLWVTANFKETQLDLIRPGQPVAIDVDACPDADIQGHVDSIQRGAGQAFAILPPENATGNYVKIVQRVPVKIELDHAPKSCILGPGMSVEPTVTVR